MSVEYLFSQQPYFIKYTTTEGLPSNEIYTTYQDSKGYIWIGTDRGVVKYDGYNFKNYGIEDGLGKLEISQIIKDERGRLWFHSYYGDLFYFENEKFYPYKFNNTLKKYAANNLVAIEGIDNDGTFLFNNKKNGLLRIDKNGQEEIIHPKCESCFSIISVKGKFYSTRIQPNTSNNSLIPLLYTNGDITKTLKQLFHSSPKQEMLKIESKIVLAIDNNVLTLLNGEIIDRTTSLGKLVNKIKMIDDDLYLCTTSGIIIYKNWKEKGYSTIPERWMEDAIISDVNQDKKSGLWITAIGEGLYYMPKASTPVFMASHNITSMSMSGDDLIVGTSKGAIAQISKNILKQITHLGGHSKEITIDEDKKVLFSSNKKLDLKTNRSTFQLFQPVAKDEKRSFKSGNFAFIVDLLNYNPKTATFTTLPYKEKYFTRIFDLHQDKNNRLWIGTDKGLMYYENERYSQAQWKSSLVNKRINTIDELSTGEIVVGTKGYGIYIGNQNTATQLKRSHGLSADLINSVWVDENNTIWAATNHGLNKITKQDNGYVIKQIHTSDGLPSEEINKILINGDHIYLATSNGLCDWADTDTAAATFTPMISAIYINDLATDSITSLKYNENNIRLEFINFDFFQNNKVKYRYKIGDHKWQYLASNELKLSSLQPDKYSIEVQAQNKEGVWSPSLSTSFYINELFYKKAWFLSLLLLLLMSLAYYLHRLRLRNVIAKEVTNTKLKELEKKAALAQFNPQFIFNATSTIQYYIATKDLKAADSYLTDFTHILRKNIENASFDFCVLSEEVELVKKYVALEQKRFDDNFTFKIFIDEVIDTISTKVPSMVIFTMCDNAINSRLMHRNAGEGELHLSIKSDEDRLIIEVLDNGYSLKNELDQESHAVDHATRVNYYKANKLFDIDYTSGELATENDQKWYFQRMVVKG